MLHAAALRPPAVTAVVVGDIGPGPHEIRAVAGAFTSEVRLCGPGIQPDLSRVQGSAVAEVSVQIDEFAEFVLAACALDPVAFMAEAAFKALRQMAA